jgi:hypothetical protein
MWAREYRRSDRKKEEVCRTAGQRVKEFILSPDSQRLYVPGICLERVAVDTLQCRLWSCERDELSVAHKKRATISGYL